MSVVNWLDIVLVVLGLLAVSPRLWLGFRCRRAVCLRSPAGPLRIATPLLFYLGIGFLATAGVDVGLAGWDMAQHFHSDDSAIFLAEYLKENGSQGPIKPEAVPLVEAPDFRMPVLDEARSIQLSDFRGHKPVVLIFGSFG